MVNKHYLLYRILDANINRTLEGLRVCEDILRFILNKYSLAGQFKDLRHKINALIKKLPLKRKTLIKKREAEKDRGRITHPIELKRKNYEDIFYANIQRSKESLRVLEEFLKLIDKKTSGKIKDIRYRVYELEKKVTLRI